MGGSATPAATDSEAGGGAWSGADDEALAVLLDLGLRERGQIGDDFRPGAGSAERGNAVLQCLVSALIMPWSATTHKCVISKRRRNRSITRIRVVASAVLPGHISEHTGRPSR